LVVVESNTHLLRDTNTPQHCVISEIVYCYTVSLTTLTLPVSRNTIIQGSNALQNRNTYVSGARRFIIQQIGMNSTLTLAFLMHVIAWAPLRDLLEVPVTDAVQQAFNKRSISG
jgi:hypothetical protein